MAISFFVSFSQTHAIYIDSYCSKCTKLQCIGLKKGYLGVMSNEITTPKPKRWKTTNPIKY